MEKESIQRHIDFLEKVSKEISGKTYQYRYGKNKKIRDQAGDTLDEACNKTDRYLEKNRDLFDFMVAHHACDPNYLEYPEWDHIEADNRVYIDALKERLESDN